MVIYDMGKEHRLTKLKLKIAVALDSYVSLNPMAKY